MPVINVKRKARAAKMPVIYKANMKISHAATAIPLSREGYYEKVKDHTRFCVQSYHSIQLVYCFFKQLMKS
jgi:hypothetical protein